MIPPPPRSTLFPYTTLFRSAVLRRPWRAAQFGLLSGAGNERAARALYQQQHAGSGDPRARAVAAAGDRKSTRLLQSRLHLVCRLLLEKKKKTIKQTSHDNNI